MYYLIILLSLLTKFSQTYHTSGVFTSVINPTPQIISWAIPRAYPNIEYNIRLSVIGGKYPYTYTLITKPTGMTIVEKTGKIVWVPQTIGGYSVSVKVEDVLGGSDIQNFDVTVTKTGFYFVSSGVEGSDTIGDGSKEKPWKTLGYAIKQGTGQRNSKDNDILYLRDGTYDGSFSFDDGDINKWIKYPNENPIVDMKQNYFFHRDTYNYFDGIEWINGYDYVFRLGVSDYSVWRRCEFHAFDCAGGASNNGFIMFADGDSHQNQIIQDNEMYDAKGIVNGQAVTMFYVTESLFENNHVYDISNACFGDKDDGIKNTIRGNFFHDCSKIGLYSQNTMDGIEINHNVLWNVPNGIQISAQPGYIRNIDIHHNNLYNSRMWFYPIVYGTESHHIYIQDNIIEQEQDSSSEYFYGIYPRTVSSNPTVYDNTYVLPAEKTIIDYNLLYHTLYTGDIVAGYSWGPGPYTMSQWKSHGKDLNSIYNEDPLYTDVENGDLSIASNSPAIAKGSDGGDIGKN